MIAGKLSITSRRGETHDETITLSIDGSPVDLSTYTALLQIREDRNEDSPLKLTLSTENGRLVLGSDGSIRRVIDATTMASLREDTYFYDLAIESPSGVIDYIVEGSWVHKPRVSILAGA